jgi:LEA14-like dessication related protein
LVGCAAILGCLAFVGCAGVPLGADPPEVELVNLTVLESSAANQHFALTFLISNPNAEPIPVEEIRYSVRLAGQGYLNGRSQTTVTLAGSGRQTLRVDLETDGVVSAARLSSFVQAPDNSLPYELSGDIVIGGQPPRMLPFATSGTVPFAISRGD